MFLMIRRKSTVEKNVLTLADAVASLQLEQAVEVDITQAMLTQSTLTRAGAVYRWLQPCFRWGPAKAQLEVSMLFRSKYSPKNNYYA
eukprot:3816594-Amphidinium_carterae.1